VLSHRIAVTVAAAVVTGAVAGAAIASTAGDKVSAAVVENAGAEVADTLMVGNISVVVANALRVMDGAMTAIIGDVAAMDLALASA